MIFTVSSVRNLTRLRGLYTRGTVSPCISVTCRDVSTTSNTHSSSEGRISEGVPYKTLQTVDPPTNRPRSLPSSADVVVIGGGSIGCSTLYHLAKLGVSNAVLIERDKLSSGTTWHTAGLVWNLRPNDTEIELLSYCRNLMSSVLEQETGLSTGWVNNGGIFIASTKERMEEYKRLMSLGKAYGIESYVLSPSETQKVYPLMNVDDMYASLYSPSDGTIDPAGWCTTLTRAAVGQGAKVIENCPVTSIDTYIDDFGVKRVRGVETSQGKIQTDFVVNCTGVWAPKIGAMAGVATPLIALKHAYVVTETIPGIKNMPNVRDHDASVYLKLQGDALCIGGYEPNPIFWENVEDNFAFSLFELDWDVFSVHVEGAVNRVPRIAETGIKSTVCGPESFTADHKPIMGESIEVRGFYHGCGFNSGGMMFGGGCGRELAHWVIHGRPELDMFGYDIRRFYEGLTSNKKWLKERSHESYAKNYSTVFIHDQPLAARNMRVDPLHQTLLDAGCVYQEKQGWERPGWFTKHGPVKPLDYDYYGAYEDIKKHTDNKYYNFLKHDYTFDFPGIHHEIGEECRTCRTRVAVFNMSYFGKVYLTGPDSQAAADWIFSNRMDKPIGTTTYTCMLNSMGGVETDLTVSNIQSGGATEGSPIAPLFEGAGFYIAIGGGNSQHSLTHIKTVLQDKHFNCTLIDHTDDMGMLSIQGPHSRDLLQTLTDTQLDNDSFPFSTNQIISVAGHMVRALRLTFVGELGWELHVPRGSCVDVYNAVMEAGKKYGVCNSGYRAIESLSMEKGYRHWHADLRSNDTPLEAGMGFTCKLKTETPFLGRAALEKQKSEGLKKKIACFTIDEKVPLLGLECIRRDGVPVGVLRRGEYAFALDKSIGYGYITHPEGGSVNNTFLKEGKYEIERMGDLIPATLHIKSPFDPQNKRIKGIYE